MGEYSFAILIIQSEVLNEKALKPEILTNHEISEITDQDVWQVYSIAQKGWHPPEEMKHDLLRVSS